jgi:hypothetical protein
MDGHVEYVRLGDKAPMLVDLPENSLAGLERHGTTTWLWMMNDSGMG